MSCTFDELCGLRQHKRGKGKEVEAVYGFWQAFIIFGQAAEAGSPGKRTLNNPSSG